MSLYVPEASFWLRSAIPLSRTHKPWKQIRVGPCYIVNRSCYIEEVVVLDSLMSSASTDSPPVSVEATDVPSAPQW